MKWNKTYTYYTLFGGLIGAGIAGGLCIYTDGFTNDKVEDVKRFVKNISYSIINNIKCPSLNA